MLTGYTDRKGRLEWTPTDSERVGTVCGEVLYRLQPTLQFFRSELGRENDVTTGGGNRKDELALVEGSAGKLALRRPARDLTGTARTLTMPILASEAPIAWPTGETKSNRVVPSELAPVVAVVREPRTASRELTIVGKERAQARMPAGDDAIREGRIATREDGEKARLSKTGRATSGLNVLQQINVNRQMEECASIKQLPRPDGARDGRLMN